MADPGARTAWRDAEDWQIWLGWVAALALHGILLAALIFSWPYQTLAPPPPNPASISLMMVPAAKPAAQAAPVLPKSPGLPAEPPATAPAKIADGQNAPRIKPSALAKAAPRKNRVNAEASAHRALVETRLTAPDNDGFVAAMPVAGGVNQPPEYPEAAQLHGEQGDVLLSIHVLPNGQADSVSVTQSSGYNILDQAAAKAVWKWRFKPSTLAGHAVPSVIPYRIHFSLKNAASN